MKSSKKHSAINRQIAGIIVCIITITLVVCGLLNTCLLGDFYLLEKQKEMKEAYSKIDGMASSYSLHTQKASDDLDQLYSNTGFSIIILDDIGRLSLSSVSDATNLLEQLNYTLDTYDQEDSVLTQEDNYRIIKQTYPKFDEDYLILIGSLSDGSIIMIRQAIEGITQMSSLANIFLIYTALIGILISAIIADFITNEITKPIFVLIDIAKRISNFEFDSKYKPQKYYNEIDDLGEHINEMSETLQRAIDQLQRANEGLKRDIELKDETEQMRKEFISNVSHELKTPIALIQGYAEGLQEGIMDDENSRKIYLDVIIDESNKMNRLVREMLVLNQLEAGQMDADFVPFNVTELVRGVIESNKLFIEAQDIELSFYNEEDVNVYADEFLVEQVFSNFFSNAIHYCCNENVIDVKYDLGPDKIRISVYNSGNNIPEESIDHIWEKFYKVDKARSREYGGSGIGLSVVKATMDLLGENFGVINKPGGVEFWFDLSRAKNVKI